MSFSEKIEPQDHRAASEGSSIHQWNNENKDQSLPVTSRYQFDSMSNMQLWAYGVGHFINDLASACWFNYLLFYLQKVVKISFGPYAILSGQIADAIATPLVGYSSDKTNTKIGKRMPWYIGGYILVIITFLPMWNRCLFCDWFGNTKGVEIFYYTFFPAMFNVGWASLQISHMSLVPSLTCCRSRRDQLNSLRNTFSFIAILVVYCSALVLFQFVGDPYLEFRYLSFICMGLGSATTLFFITQINEVTITRDCIKFAKTLQKTLMARKRIAAQKQLGDNDLTKPLNETVQTHKDLTQSSESYNLDKAVYRVESDPDIDNIEFIPNKKNVIISSSVNRGSLAEEIVSWKQWFSELQFYRYGFVYMGVRLYCNVSSTMITFYLATVLEFSQADDSKTPIQIALVPLSLYLLSVITSSLLNRIYNMLGKKITLTIGTTLCCLTSVALLFISVDDKYYIYAVAPIIGIAQAICLNTGITLISDVIGLRGSSGAFVFGSYSFLDKISSGIILFVVAQTDQFNDPNYIKWVTAIVPSAFCLFAWILVIIPYDSNKNKVEDDLISDVDQESMVEKKDKKKRTISLEDELAT